MRISKEEVETYGETLQAGWREMEKAAEEEEPRLQFPVEVAPVVPHERETP